VRQLGDECESATGGCIEAVVAQRRPDRRAVANLDADEVCAPLENDLDHRARVQDGVRHELCHEERS
jgi:hypothetical protein